ncbi:toprim domain-containing protein [Agrobacterium rubi]|uniref:P4 alpha zinc-binding domain protein n=1 Tax=Agrobacterium rubi TaxID=28099 RepID=A0ABX2IXR7_9HYPH|nr:toprim domain-containing protein [Agrobacterium rubi]NTF35540.1 P4 alpha zinc-binding domain protein [Agrobacterium rubi]
MSRHLIEKTTGKWRGILSRAGLSESFLTGKKGPCPICNGGVDRFRFDDRDGSGSYICSHCGAGYGIHLLQKACGLDYGAACRLIEGVIGTVDEDRSTPKKSVASVLVKAKALWEDGIQASQGTATGLHLSSRAVMPEMGLRSIRHHERVIYLEDGEFYGRMPAMLALILSVDGRPCGLQRTYLSADGKKAPVPSPRKIMGTLPDGAAVRLSQASSVIGIAEGVETALSAQRLFEVPTWAALTANNLEKWIPPAGASQVRVFGDNDQSFTGQAAAFSLAKRLNNQGFGVEVHIPPSVGTDWNDVLRAAP